MNDMDQYLGAFLSDTHASLETIRSALRSLETNPSDQEAVYEAMRLFHSLKSSSAMMGFQSVSSLCHAMEEAFRTLEKSKGSCDAALLTEATGIAESIQTSLQTIEEKGPDSLR